MNKILVVNLNKMDDIKVLNEFNNENNIVTSKENQNKKTIMSEKEYQELQRKSNELEYQITLDHNNNKETCYILGEKDIKQCHISFDSNNKNISKKLLDAGIEYAFNTIGMETIFINIENYNQKLIKLLDNYDFINIGEVKGKQTYLIEKEDKDIGSKTNENNKKH